MEEQQEFDMIQKEDLQVRVSICTPTFNRRPFLPFLIEIVRRQTYPKHLIEWIVVDDGSDKVEEIFETVKDELNVKYFYYPEKISLGKKRNEMHRHATGEIIIYFDDDDFYPPERISHAVEMLCANPDKQIAGSSIMHVFFPKLQTMVRFGPYGPNHATAATFAFWRKFIEVQRYDESNYVAEEKTFLKDYTLPLIQLDTCKTILVIAHDHNSFDKHTILPPAYLKACQENLDCPPVDAAKYFEGVPCVQLSSLTFEDFGLQSSSSLTSFPESQSLFNFYIRELNHNLSLYPQGSISLKPDVLRDLDRLTISRITKINQILDQKLKEFQIENERLTEANSHLRAHLTKLTQELFSLRKIAADNKNQNKPSQIEHLPNSISSSSIPLEQSQSQSQKRKKK